MYIWNNERTMMQAEQFFRIITKVTLLDEYLNLLKYELYFH